MWPCPRDHGPIPPFRQAGFNADVETSRLRNRHTVSLSIQAQDPEAWVNTVCVCVCVWVGASGAAALTSSPESRGSWGLGGFFTTAMTVREYELQ